MNHLSLIESLKVTPHFGSLDKGESTLLPVVREQRLEDYSVMSSIPTGGIEQSTYKGRTSFNRLFSRPKGWRPQVRTQVRNNTFKVARSFLGENNSYSLGRAFVRFTDVKNNLSVLVRSPTGKTLGSWRGGYFRYPRTSRNSIRFMVGQVERTRKDHNFSSVSFQYRGRGNIYFGRSHRLRGSFKVRSVSVIHRKPHNGPRMKRLRRR